MVDNFAEFYWLCSIADERIDNRPKIVCVELVCEEKI